MKAIRNYFERRRIQKKEETRRAKRLVGALMLGALPNYGADMASTGYGRLSDGAAEKQGKKQEQ